MAKKIKLAIIGNSDSPHVKYRVHKFRQFEDIDARVFDTSDYFPLKNTGRFSIKNLFLMLPKMATAAWLFKRYWAIKTFRADVVFIMYADQYSLFLSLLVRCKVVVSTWGGDILAEQGALKGRFQRRVAVQALKKADQVYCVSKHLHDTVNHLTGGQGKTKPRVLIYGIDLDDYAMDDSIAPPGIHGEAPPFIIYSPRWCLPVYNISGVIDAFAELNKTHANIFLKYRNVDIPGSADAGTYRQILEKELLRNKLLSKSKAIGLIDKNEQIENYKTSHVIISLSLSDGTPLTILEAMALGKIVVCNRIPSLEAIIEDGVNGYLVDGNNPAEVATKLLYISEHYSELVKKIGNNARQFVEQHANIDEEVRQYVSRFRQLTN